ncbi:hypothetical protein Q4485_13570 [Granulosicoccaceae sp. 1_MG-2023]|nr:hypothetical protein [Granulosicoccaceae sp. 1_MG-2023]
MSDKSGGDILQGNAGMQGNFDAQSLNSIASGGAGAVDAIGGMGMATGTASSTTTQAQTQGNLASSGFGGSDNVHGDTTISV